MAISIGNSGVPGKKKPKLTVIIAPLGRKDTPPDAPDKPDNQSPPMSGSRPAPSPAPSPSSGSGPDPAAEADATSHPVPKPGESLFHDQSQSCSTCEYFNPSGHVYGECMMHVPEADFSVADPQLSWCKYYENKNEDQEQNQSDTSQEESSELPPGA